MAEKKLKLFIDGSPLVHDHFSGVGHSLLGTVKALEDMVIEDPNLSVTLFVPSMLKHRLHQWGLQWISYQGVPLPRRVINGLQRRDSLPYLDLMLGQGIYFFPNFLNWPLARAKSVLLVHDISFELYPEFVDGPNQHFLSQNVPNSIRRADVVASVSPSAKGEIEDFYHLRKDSVLVLPNGVDRSLFYKRDKKEIDYIKASYGIRGDYFIFVSNLEPRKNIIRMLEAYRLLPKEITDKIGLLIIGGGGWNDEEIKEAIVYARMDSYKVMRPEKFVMDDDLPALYSGAKALIYPPIYEGFGMPPLEAMACGIPVVSSAVSSLPWVVGKAALLVDPFKIESMTDAMVEVLDDKVAQRLMSQAGKQLAIFSWRHSAETLIEAAHRLQAGKK